MTIAELKEELEEKKNKYSEAIDEAIEEADEEKEARLDGCTQALEDVINKLDDLENASEDEIRDVINHLSEEALESRRKSMMGDVETEYSSEDRETAFCCGYATTLEEVVDEMHDLDQLQKEPVKMKMQIEIEVDEPTSENITHELLKYLVKNYEKENMDIDAIKTLLIAGIEEIYEEEKENLKEDEYELD